ncbi:MAG TPA: SH3 domain-containing protein [Chloroflexota bacterium]|nr:SH3 domain-containing protein [Chloroflexota bacterium]
MRVLGARWVVLTVAFTSCSSVIPPQPSISVPASAPAASVAAKPAGHPQVATVTGTGQFGLSIRKEPGLLAERTATVPDGFQAAVVSGPVAKDGADWYQVKGPEVTGWASGAYLTLSAAPAPAVSAPAAPPPPGSANPLATPLSGLLSQLNRDSNYNAGGSGIFVEAPLKPAVDHLSASKTASALLHKAAPAYLRLTVAHFPATSEGGEFSTLGHSIKVADVMLKESLDVQSTVISHELQHAGDILVDHAAPDTSQDCVNLEVRAFRTQEQVWLELTKPAPARTKMEGELDQLSHVVNSPSFAQQLAKLYSAECSAYAGSTR